jgi:signal transduction histidine kinase
VLADGFEVFDGFPGTIRALSDSVATRTTTGQLWFTTDEGIAIVDPSSALPDLGAVPARISSARADDVPFEGENAAALRAGTRRVQISWAALELTTPDRVRFRYRLDGFDRDWTDAGTRHQVEYANLPPGSYVFHVAAAREGNAWTDSNSSALEFSVAPHVYQTLWFPFLIATALAAGSWAIWHIRLVQVRRRFTITLAERARVSREVHDTLLQSLVGVALQCQVLADGAEVPPTVRERLVRLRGRVDDHIGEAREMIWHLRSPMLERNDFVTALRRMADDVIEGTSVKVDVRSVGQPRYCSPDVERELLRIGQEALTNAVRHGRPSLVGVELRFAERAVHLTVTDNGCGFTPPQTFSVADGHCGLAMMHERIEEIGGRLSIASQPAQGARVEAMVPLMAGAAQ